MSGIGWDDQGSRYSAWDRIRDERRQESAIDAAVRKLGASEAEGPIPGLWNAPGYPELTTNQLLSIAGRLP